MALSGQQNLGAPLTRVLFIVLLAVSLVITTLYVREGSSGPLHAIQTNVQSLVAPLGSLGARAGSAAEGVGDAIENATTDDATVAELREQIAQLTEALVEAEEYRLENERLRETIGLIDMYQIEGVTGEVIGRSTDAWNQTVTLSVGSDDGVTAGLTVMGGSGVIGQVVTVTPGSCVVRLLTDPQSGAAALIQSNRAEGIVRGSLDGLLYLENVDADVVVNVGDVVLTSGLGGSYVRGLLIGEVVRVEGQVGSATRRIIVAPNGRANLMEEAVVVFDATTTGNVIMANPASGGDNGSGDSSGGNAGDNSGDASGGNVGNVGGNVGGDSLGSDTSAGGDSGEGGGA